MHQDKKLRPFLRMKWTSSTIPWLPHKKIWLNKALKRQRYDGVLWNKGKNLEPKEDKKRSSTSSKKKTKEKKSKKKK